LADHDQVEGRKMMMLKMMMLRRRKMMMLRRRTDPKTFARACAIEMHVDMSQEPHCAIICK